jgi:hypothetical protein
MKPDRSESEWKASADSSLRNDMEKSPRDLLHSIYEQHEKSCDYRIATINNAETKHVPIEIQLLAEKKIACLNYKNAEKLASYTRWLVILTIVITLLTLVLILQGFGIIELNRSAIKSFKADEMEYLKEYQTNSKDNVSKDTHSLKKTP